MNSPQPSAPKVARVRNHSEAFGSNDQTSAQHSAQFLQHFMDLSAQQSYQLGQKDILIQHLIHRIEMLEQENKKLSKYQINENTDSNSNASIPKSIPAKSTSNKKTYPKSVVVTNIVESAETDETEKAKSDKKAITDLIQKIDKNAVVDSVVRMGNVKAEKNRPIRVNLKTSTQKQDVISKAKDFFKGNAEYSGKKIFVNNLLSKEEHKIQMNLKNKLKELWKEAETNKSNIKFSIQNNQIYIHDSNAKNSSRLNDSVNDEAATFYKICSFRQQESTSDSAMETSPTV